MWNGKEDLGAKVVSWVNLTVGGAIKKRNKKMMDKSMALRRSRGSGMGTEGATTSSFK
jgi:hypothetical protein